MATIINGVVTGTASSETIDLADWLSSPANLGNAMYSDGLGGADTIIGTALNDIMQGGDGDDILQGQGGNNNINGGNGDDTITASGDTTNSNWLYGDAGADNITGGSGADHIYGGADSDSMLDGAYGDDSIYGEGGNDFLRGGLGTDTLDGGDGNDKFLQTGEYDNPTYNQAGGLTTFFEGASGNGYDFYEGGSGTDTLSASDDNLTLVLANAGDLAANSIEEINGETAVNFRVFVQGSGPQDFSAITLSNLKLDFGAGDDDITGSNGIVTAGVGSGGNDNIEGGTGFDTVNFAGNVSGYTIQSLGGGIIRVTDIDTADGYKGVDDLRGIEKLQFGDQSLTFVPESWQDTDATGGSTIDGIAGAVLDRATIGTNVGIDLSVAASADLATIAPSATPTYALLDNAGGLFAINTTTGVVTVAGALPDFASAPLIGSGPDRGYTLVVEADIAGFKSERSVTITLIDDPNSTPDPAIDSDASTSDSVAEGAANGTYTGITAQATDPDFGDVVTYSLTDNAGGRFAINTTTGAITVANGALLDYEAQYYWSVTVRATDNHGAVSNQDFYIYLSDFTAETPVDSDATSDAVDENATNGSLTGITASAISPFGGAMTYSLTDDAGGRFAINATTGVVTVVGVSLLDYETQSYWGITVRATDGVNINDQYFTVSLNDIAAESWTGTSGSDTFTVPGGGVWTLSGLGGADTITGGFGDDTFIGGDGNDILNGLAGNDTFQFSGSTGGLDAVDGGEGYDILQATANNTIIGLSSIANIEEITANGFSNVTLQLGSGNDTIDSNVTFINGVQAILAGNGADTVVGTNSNDTISGEDGNDFIFGGAGADILSGGNGTDTVSYVTSWEALTINLATNTVSGGDATGDTISGFENVIATDYNDTITGSTAANVITGGAGDDVMSGGDGNDIFDIGANSGTDSIAGGNGSDTIRFVENDAIVTLSALATIEAFDASTVSNARIAGDANNNTLNFGSATLTNIAGIYGLGGNDNITGSAGADIIISGDGNDTVNAGNGNDILRYEDSSEGFDALNGGGGTDTIEATASGVTIGLASITAIEQINGYGDTIIRGNTAANTLNFSAVTLSGISLIDGDADNDIISGSVDTDNIRGGSGNDTLNGGDGDDTFYVNGAAEGTDTYSGGNGFDQILAEGDNTTIGLGTSISGIEQIYSQGYQNVRISGTTGADVWNFSAVTLAGITSISGGAGTDTITGSSDADVILGGAAGDTLNGGGGIDTLSYAGSATAVTINLSTNTASGGDATGDVISNFENVTGSNGADTITGNSGENILIGGSGADRLTGGDGFDTLQGDAGNDIFDFNALSESSVGSLTDIIVDLVQGQDDVDVTTIDANTGLGGDQNFSFIGTGAFTNTAGQLRYQNDLGDGYTHIFADVNGDSVTDFEVLLSGAYTLAASDFIL